ncbi:MAG TPA: hypothetical protein VFO35_09130 [Steroidobacteraceae bacterium]|nr:hypothetical protein [Steroidobacteraceae bacterium]
MIADLLNRGCDCTVTDLPKLRERIETPAHVFSGMPVFLESAHVSQMRRIVEAVEATTRLSRYRQAVLGEAHELAHIDPGACGVFMGFDFHITPAGPRLIEINTNAGGAFLNIAAQDARRSCCPAADDYINAQPMTAQLEAEIVAMFRREWSLARGDTPLRTLAIVDSDPRAQFLYPEFELAKRLFESHGVETHIADPSELELADDCIQLRGQRIDLVYNRLTDFYFDAPSSHVLRIAHQRGLAVITPHPRAHALYADKRNLALLSNAAALEALGAPRVVAEVLVSGIPSTREAAGCAETWWRDRKGWFFKPRSGYGSRGTYRGDKLTRRVFAEVVRGGYIAQELTPPSERWRSTDAGKEVFKVDVRCYVYAGKIQLMAARLYRGQTTNFRTAGGGFAPIYIIGSDGEGNVKFEACA